VLLWDPLSLGLYNPVRRKFSDDSFREKDKPKNLEFLCQSNAYTFVFF
jgi:hypothetical protein